MADTDANTAFSRHPEFYGDSVTFLVENCLFKVPRGPFQTESIVFRDMFLLPQGEIVEGLDDERPIKLDGIAKSDFEQLLKVLLFRNYGGSPGLPAGAAQWTPVLKLSTLWEFNELRKVAIKFLSHILRNNPVDRIILARQFDITPWMLPALNELAQRPEPISVQEANRLGIETAFTIASVREKVQLQAVEEAVEQLPSRQHGSPGFRKHKCTSSRLVVGPRDSATRSLDFTPLLRAKFNL